MILEFFITFIVLFLIAIWFYTIRRESIELLQLEYENALPTLHELLQESQPIIIRGVPIPPILNSLKLAEIPRLNSFPLSANASYTLQTYRTHPELVFPDEQAIGLPIIEPIVGRTLAKELSIDTWMKYTYNDFIVELSTEEKVNDKDFKEFYNAEPIENIITNLNLTEFEECINVLERDFSHHESDLFPGTSNAIIQHYLKTIDSLEISEIDRFVFVGGVGHNYKMLHKKVKDKYNIEIQVPNLEESTLQGLGYLSSSIS